MRLRVCLVLLALAGATMPSLAASSLPEGVNAYFVRFVIDANCLRFATTHGEPVERTLPYIESRVLGRREPLVAGPDQDLWEDATQILAYRPEGEDHVVVGVRQETTGIDQVRVSKEKPSEDSDFYSLGGETVSCREEGYSGSRWAAVFCTCLLPDLVVRLEAYESYDFASGVGTQGSATLQIVHVAASTKAFLRTAADFDTGFSASGTPIADEAPRAAATVVSTEFVPTLGLVAGFAEIEWGLPVYNGGDRLTVLQYVSPEGTERLGELHFLSGPVGKWQLSAVGFAPAAGSQLYFWGADIDTGLGSSGP